MRLGTGILRITCANFLTDAVFQFIFTLTTRTNIFVGIKLGTTRRVGTGDASVIIGIIFAYIGGILSTVVAWCLRQAFAHLLADAFI